MDDATHKGQYQKYRGEDGTEFNSYYVAPAHPKGCAIILRGVAGPDTGYTEIADRLHSVGYAALVHSWLVRGNDMDDTVIGADIGSAVAFLKTRAELADRPLAVIGYCKGGGFGALAAARCAELRAVVEFHGFARRPEGSGETRRHPIDLVSQIHQPVLLLHGQNDQLSPLEGMREFVAAMEKTGGRVELHVYPGADHGFAVSTHKGYQPEAARKSFDAAVAFLDRHFA